MVKHNLQISVTKEPVDGGIFSFRRITVRERLLNSLFGSKRRVVIIVPGDSVECVSITELSEGGEESDGSTNDNSRAPNASKSETV